MGLSSSEVCVCCEIIDWDQQTMRWDLMEYFSIHALNLEKSKKKEPSYAIFWIFKWGKWDVWVGNVYLCYRPLSVNLPHKVWLCQSQVFPQQSYLGISQEEKMLTNMHWNISCWRETTTNAGFLIFIRRREETRCKQYRRPTAKSESNHGTWNGFLFPSSPWSWFASSSRTSSPSPPPPSHPAILPSTHQRCCPPPHSDLLHFSRSGLFNSIVNCF